MPKENLYLFFNTATQILFKQFILAKMILEKLLQNYMPQHSLDVCFIKPP